MGSSLNKCHHQNYIYDDEHPHVDYQHDSHVNWSCRSFDHVDQLVTLLFIVWIILLFILIFNTITIMMLINWRLTSSFILQPPPVNSIWPAWIKFEYISNERLWDCQLAISIQTINWFHILEMCIENLDTNKTKTNQHCVHTFLGPRPNLYSVHCTIMFKMPALNDD